MIPLVEPLGDAVLCCSSAFGDDRDSRNSMFWVLVINVRVTERTFATDLCVYTFFPNRVMFAPKLLALLSSLRTLSKSNFLSSSVSGILVRVQKFSSSALCEDASIADRCCCTSTDRLRNKMIIVRRFPQ